MRRKPLGQEGICSVAKPSLAKCFSETEGERLHGTEGQNLVVPHYVAMIRDLKYYEKQLGDGGSPQP